MKITFPLTEDILQKAELLKMAGDPVRIRILCFMFEHKKACVTDIAESLDVPINTISHHLQKMKHVKFFETKRIGTIICYELIENTFTKRLQRLICF
jgi:ArsR family transcriptional regulator, lead/cadmium/zinc/bismuth-responsive transcriptional repressor